MSQRVEWFDGAYLSAEVVPAGTEVGEFNPETTAVVLHGSITVVIEGRPAATAELLRELADQLDTP
jgi:hypothetical protein